MLIEEKLWHAENVGPFGWSNIAHMAVWGGSTMHQMCTPGDCHYSTFQQFPTGYFHYEHEHDAFLRAHKMTKTRVQVPYSLI